jgi:hypothetical protein
LFTFSSYILLLLLLLLPPPPPEGNVSLGRIRHRWEELEEIEWGMNAYLAEEGIYGGSN